MKVNSKREIVVEFTEEERRWLMGLLQNAIGLSEGQEEQDSDRTMRHKLFTGLKSVDEGCEPWKSKD